MVSKMCAVIPLHLSSLLPSVPSPPPRCSQFTCRLRKRSLMMGTRALAITSMPVTDSSCLKA